MWNRVDLAQRELDSLRKLVGDEDNALVQRASCTPCFLRFMHIEPFGIIISDFTTFGCSRQFSTIDCNLFSIICARNCFQCL